MARTFPNVQAFAVEVDKLDKQLQRDALKLTEEMAENAERVAVAEVRKVIPDTEFSGWPGAERKMDGLRIKQLRSRTGHIVVPFRKNAGPWTVAERGRNQGTGGRGKFFGPGLNMKTGETSFTKTGRVRMRRFGQKRWNGYTSGWGVSSKAVAKSDRDADRIAEKGLRPIIRKHFDVS